MLVNTEGDVGSVSRYTETRGSDITEAGVGFNVAAMRKSPGLFNLGMGASSIEMFPCGERTTRIYDIVSLRTEPCDILPQHLVGLVGILAFQGCVTLALKPVEREFRRRGPGMNLGRCDQPIHCIREE